MYLLLLTYRDIAWVICRIVKAQNDFGKLYIADNRRLEWRRELRIQVILHQKSNQQGMKNETKRPNLPYPTRRNTCWGRVNML